MCGALPGAVLDRSKRGSVVLQGSTTLGDRALPARATGGHHRAGDLYAAGFLFAHNPE